MPTEPHCPGDPTITPLRLSPQGTVFALSVCACGEQAEYIELEVETNDTAV